MHFVQQKCCWLWSRNCVNALQNIGELQRQQRGLNGKSESLLHRVWKIFAPENGKAEFSILFCWSGEINTPAQNIGVQLEITIWVTWFISSFESQTARLQLLSQCSQAGALCLFLAIHTKVSSFTKVWISINNNNNLYSTLKHSFHFGCTGFEFKANLHVCISEPCWAHAYWSCSWWWCVQSCRMSVYFHGEIT